MDMGRNWEGSSAPFWGGELGRSPSNTKSPWLSPTKWHLNPSSHLATTMVIKYNHGHNRYGPKIGGVPLWKRGSCVPIYTMWPGPRPICEPSFILIHPTVWPQHRNVTERIDMTGQTYRLGQDRQRSEGIGRTVLQTVAQQELSCSGDGRPRPHWTCAEKKWAAVPLSRGSSWVPV